MAIHDIPWSVVPDLLGHIPSLKVLVLTKASSICRDLLWFIFISVKPSMLLTVAFVIRIENFARCVCGVGRQRMCPNVCYSAWRQLNLMDFLDARRR